MTISTIWEPVLDAASDSGGNGGARGRGGRRSSSIIAGRRPAGRPGTSSEPEESAGKDESSDEERPRTPRRRRRTPATTAAEARSERAEDEEKPAPRRRRRTRASEAEAEERSEAAEASSDQNDVESTPAPRRRRTRSRAAESEQPAEPVAGATEAAVDESAVEPEAVVETAAPPRRRTSRPAETNGAAEQDLGGLRALVEEQGSVLQELRAGLLTLGQQFDQFAQKLRLGVFVDVPNLMYGQEPDEKPVNMGKLLELLRQGRDIVRATAYSPVSDNPSEPLEQQKFVAPFVPYEYRIVTKPLKRFADGSIKGNFDVEMAIDMLTMADRLDVIAIVSGDADFARAVEVVQTRGVRVEVVAFARSSSLEMRSLADRYIELGAVIEQVV